jgi:hypothetical protein
MATAANAPAVDKPFNTYSRAQLDRIVAGASKKLMGFSRDPKPNLPAMPPLYIFNVSDREVKWTQAGFLPYTVPACAPDKDYSEPVYFYEGGEKHEGIPGIVPYEFLEIDRTKWAFHNAEEIAAEIMQIGAGHPPEQNLELRGLFRSWSNPPKPAEVQAAKKLFLGTLEGLVKEGNFIHAQGEKKGPDGQLIGSEHLWAAGLLGQTVEWSKGAKQMHDCPICSFPVPANAAVHYGPGGCGGVIDWDKAIAAGLKKESDRPKVPPENGNEKQRPAAVPEKRLQL